MQSNKFIKDLPVTGFANEGKSIAHAEGKVVFVKGAVPGDVVNVRVLRNKRDYIEAEVMEIVQPSKDRQQPFCPHFGPCGGCQWQHMKYTAQLAYKDSAASETLERLGKLSIKQKLPIVGSDQDRYYRNKLEFTFSHKEWLTPDEFRSNTSEVRSPALGYHLPGAFDRVFDVKTCYLQPHLSDRIRLAIKIFTLDHGYDYFDLRKQTGLLRNVIIRMTTTGEVMVVVIFTHNEDKKIRALLEFLRLEFPEITSLLYVLNSKKNDSIYDLEILNYFGRNVIRERIGNLDFNISAKSFFQTNTRQAEKLYDCIKQFAALKGNEIVYDLYTGTGSIALFLADSCKKVIGIEQLEQAIVDARINASLNSISNVAFYSSDISKILNSTFVKEHGTPEVVITDPPRAGMHKDVVGELLKMEPQKIVYVSCNVATQARDLHLLSEKYSVEKTRAFDLFPQTHHVENVAELLKSF
ncbi:MAG: 23S rRNA (uracil(1939)-C(5))-methyltransferase RlmD [Chitinophagales bacterium]|nr:23S rRNA (uracil(1939)-C(5))-methyltransferase RlmD [Chitinophagales bacterium]